MNWTRSLHTLYRYLFLLICGSLIMGQVGRVELIGGTPIYLHDVLISVFLILFFIEKPQRFFRYIKTCEVVRIVLVLNVWIILTAGVHFWGNPPQLLIGFLYLLRFDSIIVFGRSLLTLLRKGTFKEQEFWYALLAIPVMIATFGFVQYFLYPDTRGLKLLGWDDHYYRLISTIFDPGFTGMILVIGCVLSIKYVVLRMKNSQKHFILHSSYFILCFMALLLTYSRASYLALIAGIVVFVMRTKELRFLLIIVGLVLGMFVLPRPGGEGVKLERTASITARVDSVSGALSDMTPSTVLFGKGWYAKKSEQPTNMVGSLVVPNHSSAPENSFIFVFSSLGIVGLGIFLFLLGSSAYVLRADAGYLSILIAVSVHALFTNTLFYPFVLILFVMIMAGSARRVLGSTQPVLD